MDQINSGMSHFPQFCPKQTNHTFHCRNTCLSNVFLLIHHKNANHTRLERIPIKTELLCISAGAKVAFPSTAGRPFGSIRRMTHISLGVIPAGITQKKLRRDRKIEKAE